METGDDQARRAHHLKLIIDYLTEQLPGCNVKHAGGRDTETILIESNDPPELYVIFRDGARAVSTLSSRSR